MPLDLSYCDDSPLCRGHRWSVLDEDRLAKLIARIASGYHLHVARILRDPSLTLPDVPPLSLARLCEWLGDPKSDVARYHRDGWVFQMISWIAANLTHSSAVLIAPPQARPADKGFDGLIVERASQTKSFTWLVICEDKATENPRKTLTEKVWPELMEFESGKRDAELQSEVTALLMQSSGNLEDLISQIHWAEHRRYRVSVTVSPPDGDGDGRKRVFKGFDESVPGGCERRQAESMALADVRDWMDALCINVITELKALPKNENV